MNRIREADVEELSSVKGMSKSAATALKTVALSDSFLLPIMRWVT